MAVTKLQISPVIVNGFENGFHQWIQRIFLVVVEAKKIVFRNIFFLNLDPLCRSVAAKLFVLEDFFFGKGTSVASALTAETGFEIVKCIADVDMLPRRRIRSKCENFRFFNSVYAHVRNFAMFWHRALFHTGNTLIKPNCASVRQSRDSLHRAPHTLTKKVAAAACSETAKMHGDVFWDTTVPVSLV